LRAPAPLPPGISNLVSLTPKTLAFDHHSASVFA